MKWKKWKRRLIVCDKCNQTMWRRHFGLIFSLVASSFLFLFVENQISSDKYLRLLEIESRRDWIWNERRRLCCSYLTNKYNSLVCIAFSRKKIQEPIYMNSETFRRDLAVASKQLDSIVIGFQHVKCATWLKSIEVINKNLQKRTETKSIDAL